MNSEKSLVIKSKWENIFPEDEKTKERKEALKLYTESEE